MTNVPDFESEPEKLEDPLWAAMSACDYWDMRKINVAADAEDFERVTRLINGGLNGYEDRKVRWEKAKLALADQEAPTAPIVEDTVPTPPKEKDMPIPAIIAAVLPSLIQSINIPKLTELFKPGSEVAERNVKVAEMVFETAKSAIGAVNEQEVVERVSADPVARESVRKAVEADWFRIDEAGGGGIAGARQADLAFVSAAGESRFAVLKSPSFLMGCLLLPLVYLIVLSIIGVVGVVAWSDDVRAALAGTIVGTIVGGLIGYYFGQTTSKNRTPAPE